MRKVMISMLLLVACGKAASTTADVAAEAMVDGLVELADDATAVDAADAVTEADAVTPADVASPVTP
jgi:hypothetical protein